MINKSKECNLGGKEHVKWMKENPHPDAEMVKCVNCGEEFDSHVEVSEDQPEIAYHDPVSHGYCPHCLNIKVTQ